LIRLIDGTLHAIAASLRVAASCNHRPAIVNGPGPGRREHQSGRPRFPGRAERRWVQLYLIASSSPAC
jgi:hypothetical protein